MPSFLRDFSMSVAENASGRMVKCGALTEDQVKRDLSLLARLDEQSVTYERTEAALKLSAPRRIEVRASGKLGPVPLKPQGHQPQRLADVVGQVRGDDGVDQTVVGRHHGASRRVSISFAASV
jgi:hypothetical protein